MAQAEAAAVNRESDVRVWLDFSDLSLLGEVREKGIVVYDAAHPERTPAVALREHRTEYKSAEGEEKSA
jgi:hypothetical protein